MKKIRITQKNMPFIMIVFSLIVLSTVMIIDHGVLIGLATAFVSFVLVIGISFGVKEIMDRLPKE